jgi:hypothetical protein
MSARLGASTVAETLEFPSPLDGRITELARVVDLHHGQYWAPESALPCPKHELFELLRTARQPTHPGDPAFMWLTDLMFDLTLFVPDADLRAAEPFLGSRGGITGRVISDEALARERERVYTLFKAHREQRGRLLGDANIDAIPNPIGKAVWSQRGRTNYVHRAEDGYAPEPEAAEPPKPLDDAGAVRSVLFLGWLPGVISAAVCAAALLLLGKPAAAFVTLVGGPIVAYVVCLTLLFAGGKALSASGASYRVQDRFITVTILIGVPVALAVALLAWADPRWGLVATVTAIVWVLLAIGYVSLTD